VCSEGEHNLHAYYRESGETAYELRCYSVSVTWPCAVIDSQGILYLANMDSDTEDGDGIDGTIYAIDISD